MRVAASFAWVAKLQPFTLEEVWMKRTCVRVLLVTVPMVGLIACSSADAHPSARAAGEEFLGAYCQRLSDCFGPLFTSAYPGGVNECVTKGIGSLSDPSAEDACTQGQIDQCTADVRTESCASSLSASTLPASCKGC